MRQGYVDGPLWTLETGPSTSYNCSDQLFYNIPIDGNNYFNCEAPQIAIRDVIQADTCEFTCDNDKPQLSFSLFTDIGKRQRFLGPWKFPLLGVEGRTDFTRVVKFGDFSQDVLAELGNPDRIHYKSEDKMKIHLGQNGGYVTDYFYNYFNLGVDLERF